MSTDHPRPLRWRAAAGITAGLLATGAALTAIAAAGGAPSPVQLAGVQEDQPGPCDEAEHAADPQCDGSTTTVGDDTTSSTVEDATTVPDGTSKTIDAAPGGTVVVEVQGGKLVIVSAVPNGGWTLDEQHADGREAEVRFTAPTARVDVNAELEDGEIRTRVRLRSLAEDPSTTVPNDDRSGPGGGADDPANHDVGDDHGDDGPNHDVGDDHGGDDSTDDHSGSGSSGSGSDDDGHGGSGPG